MYMYICIYAYIYLCTHIYWLPRWLSGKKSTCRCKGQRSYRQPTPVVLSGKSIDRGAWQAIVHGAAKSWTQISWASQVVLVMKNLPASGGDVRYVDSIPGSWRFSGGGMATHCSILAWRTWWTVEPGRLQSMGSQRVGHDWSDLHTQALGTHTHIHVFSARRDCACGLMDRRIFLWKKCGGHLLFGNTSLDFLSVNPLLSTCSHVFTWSRLPRHSCCNL